MLSDLALPILGRGRKSWYNIISIIITNVSEQVLFYKFVLIKAVLSKYHCFVNIFLFDWNVYWLNILLLQMQPSVKFERNPSIQTRDLLAIELNYVLDVMRINSRL